MKGLKYIFTVLIFFISIQVFSANYYWVGGTGNWSDLNHWRTESGGNLSPGVVPGPDDNVFFDTNSGFTANSKTVSINLAPANCKNIIFSGSVTAPILLSGPSNRLDVYGNSQWQNGMTVDAIIYYKGTDQTITSNGVEFNKNVQIEAPNGIVKLGDALYLNANSKLILNKGTFDTKNFEVKLNNGIDTSSGSDSKLILNNSNVTLKNISNLSNISLVIEPGNSNIFLEDVNSVLVVKGNKSFNNVTFLLNGTLRNNTTNEPGLVSFNKVEFKSDGIVEGNNIYGELILAGGKKYTFEKLKQQTITTSLTSLNAGCLGLTSIMSNSLAEKTTFKALSGVVINVSGATINDVAAEGGATFTSSNSTISGVSTGWTMGSVTEGNMFWIGGSGNWNDPNHWSLQSGGSSEGCLPKPTDNVFFDANSGFTSDAKTITIDNLAYCKNITFSGSAVAPVLTQNGLKDLYIYGSSEWQSGMTVDVNSIYYRNLSSPKQIKSNGVTTGSTATHNTNPSTVYFEESNTIKLVDDFKVGRNLSMGIGTWDTDSKNVTIQGNFLTTSNGMTKILKFGASIISLTSVNAQFKVDNPDVSIFTPSTSLIVFENDVDNNNGILGYNLQNFNNIEFKGKGTIKVLGTTLNGNNFTNFNTVTFRKGGLFFGDISFNNLNFSSNQQYTFESKKSYKINETWNAIVQPCEGLITITTNASDKANIIGLSNAVVNVSGALISNTAVSGTIFDAQNSVDYGSNTGWVFVTPIYRNIYWIGGSGNWSDSAHWVDSNGVNCIPGPNDNVFFNQNSGFNSNSKTVTLDIDGFCHNITVENTVQAPTFTEPTARKLNIFGSSVWQAGMILNLSTIAYQYNNEDVTITSNGVVTGKVLPTSGSGVGRVSFNKSKSVTFTDNFTSGGDIYLDNGTLNTNNKYVKIGSSLRSLSASGGKTLNLGSSQVDVLGDNFSASSIDIPENTSVLNMLNLGASNGVTVSTSKAKLNEVYFVALGTFSNSNGASQTTVKKLKFSANGKILGNNTIDDLIFSTGKSYTLEAGKTQTIKNWTLGGIPCVTTEVESSSTSSKANISITGTNTNFDFANIKWINAVGQGLHFGSKSTVAGQNNNNITYDTYNPGAFEGLAADWLCHVIDNNDPNTYTINTNNFYGNDQTVYQWYKLNDPNYNASTVIATTPTIDIRNFGFGTYKVAVQYIGASIPCNVTDEINIVKKTEEPVVFNEICQQPTNYLSDAQIVGVNLKWYATATETTVLATNTVIQNAQTYFVTQTVNECESNRVPVTFEIASCLNGNYTNPSLRVRVSQ